MEKKKIDFSSEAKEGAVRRLLGINQHVHPHFCSGHQGYWQHADDRCQNKERAMYCQRCVEKMSR